MNVAFPFLLCKLQQGQFSLDKGPEQHKAANFELPLSGDLQSLFKPIVESYVVLVLVRLSFPFFYM